MKATILLTTNPGRQKDAYAVLEDLSKHPQKGAAVVSVMHVFGRFDGMIICDFTDPKNLGRLAESLREKGVFQTETLIAIE